MNEYAYVYILSNGFKKLYIGSTTTLQERVFEHKTKKYPYSHTARYNINQLVYFEQFARITAGIARERQLKGWLRICKLELIVSTNPTWRDLTLEWNQPTTPFDSATFAPPNH